MKEWNKLKDEIKIETKDFFRDKPQINVDKILDLLQAICSYPIDSKYKLDGVAIKVPKAMYEILDENTTKKNQMLYFEILSKFEPFLRKLLCIINTVLYDSLLNQNKGLAAIISALHLNDARINYNDDSAQNQRSYTDYNYHLYRVYNLRNVQSHDMELWSTSQLAQNIESIFIFYICVIEKNLRDIENVIETLKKHDYTEYMCNLKGEFEKRARRFVHIETIEDYSVFEGYAIEHIDLSDENESHERTGTIEDIRKNFLPEKRMMIWGDAGMGKSTTLQYLSYLDADEYIKGTSLKIPVYVPLGLLIDIREKIEDYIIKKIGAEYIEGRELLEKGEINLFLDAVNEVPVDVSKAMQIQRRKEIQYLLDTYPNMQIIISNRPERYNYFKNIPVFRLQKMDKTKIEEFMNKNVKDASVKSMILGGIENNFRLQQLIGIPLMATRLVEIVMELKEFPQSEGSIIDRFIKSLYKREVVEKKDAIFDEQKINYLLYDLAEYSLDKYNTNSGMSKSEVIQCFANCMSRMCFSYDSIYVIDKLVELGVLECEKDIVVFAHQAYQDYFYSQAEKVKSISISNQKHNGTDGYEDMINAKSENVAFYKQKSNELQYEKSTIYLLHSYEGEQKIVELLELMRNNLYLASKVVTSGDYSVDIEERIGQEAVDKIQGNKKKELVEGFLTLLELGKYSDIIKNINVFVANKRNKYMISNIITQLDSENMLMFFEALLRTKNFQIISIAVNAVYMRDYEYTWNNQNMNVIERISKEMDTLYNCNSKTMLKYFISFNVPKKYIKYDETFLADKLLYREIDLAEKFIQKYKLDISIQYDDICQEIISKNKWTAARNLIYLLDKMTAEKKIYYFKIGIERQNMYLLYYVLNILSVEQRNEYLKLFGMNMDKNKYMNIVKLPLILSRDEAERILQINGNVKKCIMRISEPTSAF